MYIYPNTETMSVCVSTHLHAGRANLPKSPDRSTHVPRQLKLMEAQFSPWTSNSNCKTHFMQESKNKQTNRTPSHHGTFKKYFPRAKWLFPLPHKLAAKSGTELKTSHACRIRYKICRKAGTYFLTTVCSSHISQLLSSLM